MSGVRARDIAEELGLSAAAVSLALNGKPGVSERTREMVLAAAIRRGYQPAKPRETQAVRGGSICFMIYYEQSGVAEQTSFSTFVLKGVERRAKVRGYRTLFTYYHADQPFEEQLEDAAQRGVSGIVILGTDMTGRCRAPLKDFLYAYEQIPVVIVDNFIFSDLADCVGNDNVRGAQAAVSYLIARGHRRIGYLRSRRRITNYDDRELGVRLALGEHPELALPPLQTVNADIASEQAYADLCAWLDGKPELPDAFFAENDVVASASIRAFKSRGIRVPEDVSVIGFDDIPVCEMMEPPITTMRSFKERLGETAVELLERRIRDVGAGRASRDTGFLKVSVSMRLMERGSVARRGAD